MYSTTIDEQSRKYFLIVLSMPLVIDIQPEETVWGKKLKYISHISQEQTYGNENYYTYFVQDEKILVQNEKGDLHQSSYGDHLNVKIIAVLMMKNWVILLFLLISSFMIQVFRRFCQSYISQ